jgi:hypothetical protein
LEDTVATDPEAVFTDVKSYLDVVTDAANEAVERLESIASLPFQIWVEFAAQEAIELAQAPVIADKEFPTLDKVDFDTALGEFDPNAYKENIYDSSFFTFLEPYLTEQINAGGPGISDALQEALWDNQRERDLQLLADVTNAVRANYSKTGFPLPTQVLRGQENEVIKKYQDDKSNRNREITALLAERAVDFVKTAMSVGVNMEEARMQFALGFAGVFNSITAAIIDRFKAEQDARIVEFKGALDVIMAELEVGKINAGISLDYQAQRLKQWEISSTQAVERTKALISEAEQTTQVKLEAAKSLASYHATIAGSAASTINALSGDITTTTTTIAQ